MEDAGRVPRQRLAELDTPARLYHAGKDLAPIFQGHIAQIVAIEVQEIERDKVQVVLPAGDRLAQFREVGQALVVEHNDLAVDDRAFGAEACRLLHQVAIFRRPVMPVTGVDPGAVLVDDELRAVAVELDLMNPVFTLRRLLHKGRHQWLDELQTHELTRKNEIQSVFAKIVPKRKKPAPA